jgi:hypothetical protein
VLTLHTADETTEVADTDLVAEGSKETAFTIRFLTIEKHRELVKQFTKPIANKRTHVMEHVTDWEAVADAQFEYVLVDWRGVTLKGAPIPCTTDFKKLVDATRRSALLVKAGLNEVQAAPERRAESFREVEAVHS